MNTLSNRVLQWKLWQEITQVEMNNRENFTRILAYLPPCQWQARRGGERNANAVAAGTLEDVAVNLVKFV